MTSDKVKKVSAYEILDSRGFPTVACVVETHNRHIGKTAVPSGASTGAHEALELRDNNMKRYNGKGVLKAINNIENKIAPKVVGLNMESQRKVDEIMRTMDGTENKSRLGANAMLGVSFAFAAARAVAEGKPLYQSLQQEKTYKLPLPLFNVINGGAHADSGLSVQEFKIIPVGATTFKKALQMGSEVFQALKKDLAAKGLSTAVGDEGGFAPRIGSSEAALKIIVKAIQDAGYKLTKDFVLDMDVAASEFYKKGVYTFEGKKMSSDELQKMYENWMRRFPIVSIEDPFDQDDWAAWKKFTTKHGSTLQIIGDDLVVTNAKRLQRAIAEQACNALIVKPNQIGTLTETIEVIQMAHNAGFGTIMSHRSGETTDTTISDIAVAFNLGQIKAGSLSRGERLCKYNRILEIERELGKSARLAKTKLHEILR